MIAPDCSIDKTRSTGASSKMFLQLTSGLIVESIAVPRPEITCLAWPQNQPNPNRLRSASFDGLSVRRLASFGAFSRRPRRSLPEALEHGRPLPAARPRHPAARRRRDRRSRVGKDRPHHSLLCALIPPVRSFSCQDFQRQPTHSTGLKNQGESPGLVLSSPATSSRAMPPAGAPSSSN